ncbi:hypothetical protein H1R20_g458, partial [Candolleomyces eurysporus]
MDTTRTWHSSGGTVTAALATAAVSSTAWNSPSAAIERPGTCFTNVHHEFVNEQFDFGWYLLTMTGTESGPSGIFNFNGLVTAGFLDAEGSVTSGVNYKFDNCSKIAFAYDKSKSVMISYDDATTFAAKGQLIVGKRVKGFSIWHAVGDSNNILLDAVNSALSH